MYIAVVPNRSSPPAILLRESFREGGKVKNRTLANLSAWSGERIDALRQVLRGRPLGPVAPRAGAGLEIVRSWPHGHVAAVLGSVRRVDLERVLAPKSSTARALVVAMLVQRLLAPSSKLATARSLAAATRTSTLSAVLGLPAVDEDDLYTALDWLLPRQGAIEQAL
ncbi:MAG: IS1634 family transposase, partial [Candidatus Rokuibacteriota bacterium]